VNNRRGVTLLEMLIVVALIGLLAGITFPAVTSGSIRCGSTRPPARWWVVQRSADSRRPAPASVEVAIFHPGTDAVAAFQPAGFEKEVVLPPGISILSIQPEPLQPEDGPRRFLLYPGGAAPRLEVVIANAKNARRAVRLDPITGVATVRALER